LLPKFANPQIVAEIIKIQRNQGKIVQFGGYRIPLATRKKPDAQWLAGAAGSGLVAVQKFKVWFSL